MSSPRFVLHNSVVMAWCFEDEVSAYADAVLELLDVHEAVVPAIWPLETGNVLLVAERRKRLGHAGVVRFLELIQRLPIVVEQETPARMLKEIHALARSLHLSTYDASYLDLAMRAALPLASQDKALVKAARKCGIPLLDPVKARKTE